MTKDSPELRQIIREEFATLRAEEEAERRYWTVGDEYLFGNRLRWAGRMPKYRWRVRVTERRNPSA